MWHLPTVTNLIKDHMSTGNINDASGMLFDKIMLDNGLKNDAALSRFLEVNPPVISKVRHGRLTVSAQMKIDIHKKTRMPISEIEKLIDRLAVK